MLKNYFEVDENQEISSFLKNIKDKKHAHYIILKNDNSYYVDIRNVALKINGLNDKLKSLKRPLTNINKGDDDLKFEKLLDSGDRVIRVGNDYYDFIDALEYILKKNYSFLEDKLKLTIRKEIFALNLGDKISQARSLFIKERINLLPVIDEDKRLIGELRPIDLMVGKLYDDVSNKADYYDDSRENKSNLLIDSFINKRPILLNINMTYREAIEKMIDKKLASLIIVDGEKLYSIISYKDIFKLVKEDLDRLEYNLEYIGVEELFDDDLDLIMDLVDKTMKKILTISDYDSLKISFKTHGNTQGTHKKKFEVNLILSKGNKIIRVNKEILGGTSDELTNDRVKVRWNTPQLVQEALKVLLRKVVEENRN